MDSLNVGTGRVLAHDMMKVNTSLVGMNSSQDFRQSRSYLCLKVPRDFEILP